MRVRLEVFRPETAAAAAAATVVTDIGAMEEARLAAYEQGYAAGWEDAAAAAAADSGTLGAELGQHLQTLGFTYHEARAHVLRAIEPLLTEMTGRVLPAMARDALAQVVVETLRPLAAQMATVPVVLTLHPDARPAVELLLLTEAALPLTILEDPGLSTAEARLRLDDTERHIDLAGATEAIAVAVREFFQLTLTEDPAHG